MMTPKVRLRDRRRAARRRQTGFGLLEAVIGMVMVALLIGAGATGLQVLQTTSTGANQTARLDAALVAAGESVKNSDYIDCARSADYEPALAGLAQDTASGPQGLTIDSVTQVGCGDTTDVDSGIQEIGLKATKDGRERVSTITKIDSNKRLRLPKAVIDHPPIEQAVPGDVQAVFGLTATESSGEEGLVSFNWDCGNAAGTRDQFNSGNETMFCTYVSEATEREVFVTLTVTDRVGQQSTTEKKLVVPPTLVPRPPPTASAAATPRPSPTPGVAPLTVDFSSAGSQSIDGSISGYEWDFGDGNTSSEPNPTHIYQTGKNYNVILTVTDNLGLTDTDVVDVSVTAPDEPDPIANLAELPWYYVGSSVAFNASGSAPATSDSAPIERYEWDFGDSSPVVTTMASQPTISHPYSAHRLYTVRLTAIDEQGLSSSVVRYLDIRPLPKPTNFRLTAAQSTRVWPFFRSGYMSFAWDRIDPGPIQDPILVRIETDDLEINGTPVDTPCWTNRTKDVLQSTASSTQTYTWRAPIGSGPFNVLDFKDMFCRGSTVSYKYQTVRNPGTASETTSQWSDTYQWSFR